MTNEIWLYDDIGPAWAGMLDAKWLVDELGKFQNQSVTLRINSPGGDVHQAMAMYGAIQRHGNVTAAIDGVAASSASYLAMAAKEINIAANAMLMIHDPWTIAMGNATDLRETADILDKHADGIVAVYAARSGKANDEIAAAMHAETWYTAQEAVAFGLADKVGAELTVSASIKPGRFVNTPAALLCCENQRDADRSRRIAAAQRAIRIAMKR